MKIESNAKKNISTSKLNSYSLDTKDFEIISGWNYLAFFLLESRESLILSKKLQIEVISTISEQILPHGMFKNFVLTYSKCFTSAGGKKIRLDPNNVFKDMLHLKIIHNRILEARNKYVAHNDKNDYDISLMYTNETEKEIILAPTYTIMTPLNDYELFLKTIEHCEQYVIVKFNKKLDKLETKIGKKITFN